MKSLAFAVIAAALATPLASFAQQADTQVSRAQVRAELVQLENAGYKPGTNDTFYPQNIQAAQARASEQHIAQAQPESYGSSRSGSAQSGRATRTVVDAQGVFFGQ
jgi:hypothetical protein